MKKILIHDLPRDVFAECFPALAGAGIPDGGGNDGEFLVIGPEEKEIRPCVGCFGCWVSTPGACVISDGAGDYGSAFGAAEELILLTRVRYGGYGGFVKRIMDRNIGYLSPFFVRRNGEMHHRDRYGNHVGLTVIGYSPEEEWREEEEDFCRLVQANALNLNSRFSRVYHVECASQAAKLKEVFGG